MENWLNSEISIFLGANFGRAKSRIPSNKTQLFIIIIIILKIFFIAAKFGK